MEEIQLGMLKADDHRQDPTSGNVPGRLEHPGRLAGSLGAANQDEILGVETAPQHFIQARETGRDGSVARKLPLPQSPVELLGYLLHRCGK